MTPADTRPPLLTATDAVLSNKFEAIVLAELIVANDTCTGWLIVY